MESEQFRAIVERQVRIERKINFLAEVAIWTVSFGSMLLSGMGFQKTDFAGGSCFSPGGSCFLTDRHLYFLP